MRARLQIFLLLFAFPCSGQTWEWVGLSDPYFSSRIIGHDKSGNTYFGNSVYKRHDQEIYDTVRAIVKITSEGRIAWETDNAGDIQFNSIFVTDDGSAYVTGQYNTNNYVSLGEYNLPRDTSQEGDLIFIAKLSSDGEWINYVMIGKSIGSTTNVYDELKRDTSGNFYLTMANSELQLNGQLIYSGSAYHLIKLDPAFNVVWRKTLPRSGWGLSQYFDMAKNGNIVYIVHPSPGPATGDRTTIYTISSSGNVIDSVYFLKNSLYVSALDLDDSSNIYVAGYYAMDIDRGNGYKFNFGGGESDGFAMKIGEDLNVKWIRTMGKPELFDNILGIAIGNMGNVFINGNVDGEIYFGDLKLGEGHKYGRSFIIELDNAGNFLWSLDPTIVGYSSSVDLFSDKCGNIYYLGFIGAYPEAYYYVQFGDILVTDTDDSLSSAMIYFLAKLNPNKPNVEVTHLCGYDSLWADEAKRYDTIKWELPDGTVKMGHNILYFNPEHTPYEITVHGYSKEGCTAHETKKIESHLPKPPTSGFTFESAEGCQWVGLEFTDTSITDSIHPVMGESFLWDFGDGTTDTVRNPKHIFTASGVFTVNLIYSNGFCSDTFTSPQNITITPAPKPGFSVSTEKGCTPLVVQVQDESEGEVISYSYTWGGTGLSVESSPEITFTIPGSYTIVQELTGATGCVTRDSALITVQQGFSSGYFPQMIKATIVDTADTKEAAFIAWERDSAAEKYILSKYAAGGTEPVQVIEVGNSVSYYYDADINAGEVSYTYVVEAIDSCGNFSGQSLKAKTILLTGENHKNEYALLSWTPYEQWDKGVKEYTLELKDSNGTYPAILTT
ncbi:MAG: PKD domain-containing protein, partial [Bacteroidota bacterium]|nr:PKD domain-containing protein [Bacteroidota bacterium]